MSDVNEVKLRTSPKGKILLYVSTVAFSHVHFAFTIGEWLVADGFEVHVLFHKILASDNYDLPKNFAKSYVIESSGKTKPNFLTKLSVGASNLVTSGFYDEINELNTDLARTIGKASILKEIKKENYDIFIGESLFAPTIMALQQVGVKKFIQISPLPFNSTKAYSMGLPAPTSYLPFMDECFPYGDNMRFLDRARNLYTSLYADWYLTPKMMNAERAILREMGCDPEFGMKLAKQSIDLRVYNSNILMDYPRPTTHNIIHIGGSMTKEPSELSKTVAKVFEKPSDGVILISFGTIAESSGFPKAFLPSVLATMKALPSYEFIYRVGKIEENQDFAALPNVTLVEWMDQVSILANPKTKLFYTHCGLNSLNEALSFGVPIVGTPIFGDQHYNASILQKKKVGINVELTTITPVKLIAAFKTVLGNGEYAKEARQIAQKTKDLPIQPKETFLRWANYIHIHGAAQDFTLKSATMSYVELHSLDVLFAVLLSFVFAVYVGNGIFANLLNALA